jgi:Major Facilitator Superfamily
MRESRDASRASRIDWAGASLAVLGLGGLIFALLEWPRLGGDRPLVLASMAGGVASLVVLVVVERRVSGPMLPLGLFRSRTFTLANLLTLLLYGALGTVFWLVPLNLIQVHHYTATGAGAAFLPFPVLMFLLSRWSGGLVASIGSRVPLTIGPIVAALGLALYARPGIGGSYWVTFLPAVTVLGLGMAIVVAPLTTTAMTAVEAQHAGVASGVNNAVSRVAGLVAIAVLGLVLVHAFNTRVTEALDRLELPTSARIAVDRELPKLAGAEIVASIDSADRLAVRRVIDDSFVSAFRLVMSVAAVAALGAAIAGALIR